MMRAVVMTLACAALLAQAAQAAPLHRYAVRVDESLDRIAVDACFDGAVPGTLVADEGAARFLQHIEVRGAPAATVRVEGSEAAVVGAPPDACIVYRVQLQPRVRGQQSGGPETRRIDGDLLTAIGDWLWRPAALEGDEDIEVAFELPPSVAVSAPWRRMPEANAPTFRLAGTPADWPGVVAFGRFLPVSLVLPGAHVELAIVGDTDAAQRAFVAGWVERAVRGVATGYGRFPVPSLQVVVAPAAQRGRSPVPWAYVARGGGPAVHLFVDLARDDIERDWSLTHELSHLFLPYLEARDAWLFEGLPTYLQNVLMARSGTVSEEEAWRRMHQGFVRGAAAGRNLSLREASARNGRGGVYQRVYWGGAAYLLAADLGIRGRAAPGLSLDTALAGLRDCCSDSMRRYGAQEIVARMDAATGTTVFSELAAELLDRPEFPDYERLFRDLGIEMLGGHPILGDGPGASVRTAIMGAR
jgi:hypothetical protein